jgi:hypothetical protein
METKATGGCHELHSIWVLIVVLGFLYLAKIFLHASRCFIIGYTNGKAKPMTQDEAFQFIVHALRQNADLAQQYGYGVYLPVLMEEFVYQAGRPRNERVAQQEIVDLCPPFYSAAWELCRRGVFRPGVMQHQGQVTDDGSGGNGYSITEWGRAWLAEDHGPDYIPTDPNRFSQMMAPFQLRYGSGFTERAREAIRCYNAGAFLACTVMCGAAAESILLAVACSKRSEAEILPIYNAANGRSRVERVVFDGANGFIQRTYPRFTDLVKYWRDEAAHGQTSQISDDEAYTSLVILLRFCHFMNDHWHELIQVAP